ncbi:S16 family serine protease [uncultured Ilumatobacter sp.]|uniref:S16 family serine protease n=1 Tax=uncultured Ilumatobacter sp. TaxID=879968 RepID=UPI00374EA3D9
MTDTTNNMVLNPPMVSPGMPAPNSTIVELPRARWLGWLLGGLGLVVMVGIAVAALVPAALVAQKENRRLMELQPAPFAQTPASAESVNERVVFGDLPDEVKRFETSGDFFFVTVSAPEQSLLSWFAGRDDPAIDLLTAEDKFGVRTPSQRREAALQQMRTASQEAQFVALTAAGYEPEISLGEVVVEEVLCREIGDDGLCAEFYPSDLAIDPSDTILEADGIELNSVEDLSAVLEGKMPGDTIDLKVRRPEVGILNVTVELAASPDDPTRTIVGFRPFDTRVVSLPFEVDIDTGRIGGPSAGLAFALALLDELTEGELTGGRNIAVTGTISLDGSVGPIGGLSQKVNAVWQHHVDVFLVPASQRELAEGEDELRKKLIDAGHGDVEIVPVATLEEALQVLEDLGGDPLVSVNVVLS